MKKQHIRLNQSDLVELKSLLQLDGLKLRIKKRIQSLLQLHEGSTYIEVARNIKLSVMSQRNLVEKYKSEGLKCIYDNPRSGRPISIDASIKAQIMALYQSDPPMGHIRWSTRLLAKELVAKGVCEKISHTQISKVLKENQ